MDKLKRYWWVVGMVVVVLLILGCLFYWYQWRPLKLREDCYQKASSSISDIIISRGDVEEANSLLGLKDKIYHSCLHSKGLKE